MDDVLKLIQTTYERNKYGQNVPVNTEKEVFCERSSVGRNDFYNAGRNGLNPQFVFKIFKGEYEGESICEYKGQSYSIYRTYETDDDYIELYVERKGGTNGEKGHT